MKIMQLHSIRSARCRLSVDCAIAHEHARHSLSGSHLYRKGIAIILADHERRMELIKQRRFERVGQAVMIAICRGGLSAAESDKEEDGSKAAEEFAHKGEMQIISSLTDVYRLVAMKTFGIDWCGNRHLNWALYLSLPACSL